MDNDSELSDSELACFSLSVARRSPLARGSGTLVRFQSFFHHPAVLDWQIAKSIIETHHPAALYWKIANSIIVSIIAKSIIVNGDWI
mmetsp:Transcript_12899/g.23235  ORF Transcript_12899/g.23235 Transcript_12899/m.23235 type:complete len:87 (-) Transcript_12899:1623-1883(-)